MPDRNDDVQDTGEPIAELAELAAPIPAGFMERVRRRIDRRETGSQVLSLTWYGAAAVFFEFLRFFFEPFESKDRGGPS